MESSVFLMKIQKERLVADISKPEIQISTSIDKKDDYLSMDCASHVDLKQR